MDLNPDENSLLNSLRAGDEASFLWLVEQYHPSLVRLARLFVRDEAVAEEVVQDTWLAVLQGLTGFEGRSKLKTWIYTILINKAKTRGQREGRTYAFSDLLEHGSNSPTVAPERFIEDSTDERFNHWKLAPSPWTSIPEEELLSSETMKVIQQAIDALPESQKMVITLRDIEELPSQEICNILGISETNQRVMLHRARARVREALENYLQPEY
jgi:RNA polymerase sigma-70 factor (ECF subfamily)